MKCMSNTDKGHAVRTGFLLAGIFLFMLLLNHWMPIHRDDYDYSMIWGTAQHIQSFGDVCQSMWNHYMTHGGRMVTVFVLDLFLWLGKLPFDIANAAVFTAVTVLLYCHSTRDTRITAEPGILALCAFFLWLCLPHFGEVAVWKSGSTVYLWSGFFAALFLLPYNLFLAGRIHWGAGMALPMFLLGILGGWSVENLAVTVVLLTAGISWYAWKHHAFSLWLPAGAAGAFLGFIGLLAAPGNYVRYGEQGTGKGLLIHIGNQLAGNGEMFLYLLPAVLLLLLVWRVLKIHVLAERGVSWEWRPRGVSAGQIVCVLLLAAFVVSYFSGGFIGNGIRDLLVAHVLAPLHQDSAKIVFRLAHVMKGFEEMAIFWAGIFLIYSMAKKALGLDNRSIRRLNQEVRARDVWASFPEVRFAGCMIALCFFNNFVMIAAPTFPARATFSSVCMFLAGVVAVLRIPVVQEIMEGTAGRILRIGGGAVGGFLAAAALLISIQVTEENDARITYMAESQGSGEIQQLPPMETENRALRHVFFVDFSNGVTKGGLCRYYGIQDIQIQ